MGKGAREKRLAFFAQHPFCCFCGGDVEATEIGHIPAGHLFKNRGWVEGYKFPACSDCNRSSSSDELVMGFIVRIQITDLDGSGLGAGAFGTGDGLGPVVRESTGSTEFGSQVSESETSLFDRDGK